MHIYLEYLTMQARKRRLKTHLTSIHHMIKTHAGLEYIPLGTHNTSIFRERERERERER